MYASSLAATGATNTIAVGGAVSGYGSSEGIGGRAFTFSDVSSAIAVGGLGGTESTGNADSSGIHNSGYLTTEDSAKVLAVANAAEDCSWGTYNTIHAKGGIIATIGGRAGYNSSGNDAGMETYEGGKIIALGGIGDRSSYGTYTGAYPNHGGDIIVAVGDGRKLRLKVKPGTQPGTKVRLRGKGQQGTDLIITFQVVLPTSLSPRQQDLLRQMQGL
jgi:hypothetical protein